MTVVIPVLNEELHLRNCVESLLDDRYPRDRMEMVIADGGSTDRTREIAAELEREYPVVRLVPNPGRTQAAAMNLIVGREVSEGPDYFMRIDAHAMYPSEFITRAMSVAAQRDVAVVVYCARAVGTLCIQRAVAEAQNTPIGVGNSQYRLSPRSGFVEHGFHGLFRADAIRAVGGYDTDFRHNEDAELSYRLRQQGCEIWLDRELVVDYVPRSTLKGLARQYYGYGSGRAQNVRKHRQWPKMRQLAPAVWFALTPVLILLAFVSKLALAPLLAYALVVALTTVFSALRYRSLCYLWMAAVVPTMHYSWGAGFGRRLLRR